MVLYIRRGCHLCEAFIEELVAHHPRWLEQLRVVDVDDSPETASRFGELVPVMVRGDAIICTYFFDSERLFPYFHD